MCQYWSFIEVLLIFARPRKKFSRSLHWGFSISTPFKWPLSIKFPSWSIASTMVIYLLCWPVNTLYSIVPKAKFRCQHAWRDDLWIGCSCLQGLPSKGARYQVGQVRHPQELQWFFVINDIAHLSRQIIFVVFLL